MYKTIHTLEELQEYLSGAAVVAFDFETAPDDGYRKEDKAALDAHKSHIAGISFSVSEADGVYLPLAHRIGRNAADPKALWDWLAGFFADPAITKIAHNLAFESAFLYARGIVIQEPVYDTIAAAQLIYKNEKEFRGLGDCGLKTLVPEYFKEELPSFSDTVGNRHFDDLDPAAEKTIRYACADADYALRLYHLLNNWLEGSKRLCEVKDNRQSDLWEIKRPMKSPEHPTMKPIALAARAMENSSYNGDAVLDLFGGSGTTLMAAEQLERSAYLMELSPIYCDVICRRYRDWQKTDEGIFLLRNGEKMAFCEVPDP